MGNKALQSLILSALAAAACSGCQAGNPTSEMRTATRNGSAAAPQSTAGQANANSAAMPADFTREEYERNKEAYLAKAEAAGEEIGPGESDGWLWVKTKATLAQVEALKDATIKVDVVNAVITLRGQVLTEEQAEKAKEVAESMEGQRRVDSQLIVYTDDPPGSLPTPTPTVSPRK